MVELNLVYIVCIVYIELDLWLDLASKFRTSVLTYAVFSAQWVCTPCRPHTWNEYPYCKASIRAVSSCLNFFQPSIFYSMLLFPLYLSSVLGVIDICLHSRQCFLKSRSVSLGLCIWVNNEHSVLLIGIHGMFVKWMHEWQNVWNWWTSGISAYDSQADLPSSSVNQWQWI